MKASRFLLTLAMTLGAMAVTAQNSFNYQAVIRDGGKVLENKTVNLRLSMMLNDSIYYQELQPVTTNAYGNVSVNVGEGDVLRGSFSAIPWESMRVMLQVEVSTDGSANYTNMGAMQIQPVPYAYYAARATVIQPDGVSNDPIFQVKDNEGNLLFAVFETGVKVYVDKEDGGKAAKSKFAVAGRSVNKDEQPMLVINTDGSTVYVDNDSKAAKSRFAVAGRSAKGEADNLLTIDGSGSTIYVDGEGKAAKSRFAVAGRSARKAADSENQFTLDGDGETLYVDFNNAKGSAAEMLTIDGDNATFYIDLDENNGKAAKSRFAVAGRSASKGEQTEFVIDGSGTHVYVDDDSKAAKSRFAVAGRSNKSSDSYFFIDNDSTRIYIDDAVGTSLASGFAIVGMTQGTDLFSVKHDSTFIKTNTYVEDLQNITGEVRRLKLTKELFVSSKGDDEKNDGSEELPYATIARAVLDMDDDNATYTLFVVGTVSEPQRIADRWENNALIPVHAKIINLTGKFGNDNDKINGGWADEGSYMEDKSALTIDTRTHVNITNLTITGAHHSTYGGGINVSAQSTVTIGNGAIITNNTAMWGGGIYSKGVVEIKEGAIISDNEVVTDYGGGIYVKNESGNNNTRLTISGGTISGSKGEGVYADYNTKVVMTGGTICDAGQKSNNRGMGRAVIANIFYMDGGTICNNGAGGVSIIGNVNYPGAMYMSGSAVVGDSTKTEAATADNCSNKASQGAGVYVGNYSTLYMGYETTEIDEQGQTKTASHQLNDNAGICYNYAAHYDNAFQGGGVYLYGAEPGGSLVCNSGRIAYNAADGNGGGVYFGTDYYPSTASLSLSGSAVIIGNRAAYHGSEVYANYSSNVFKMSENAIVDSVYLGNSATITLVGNLTGSQNVKIDMPSSDGQRFDNADSHQVLNFTEGATYADNVGRFTFEQPSEKYHYKIGEDGKLKYIARTKFYVNGGKESYDEDEMVITEIGEQLMNFLGEQGDLDYTIYINGNYDSYINLTASDRRITLTGLKNGIDCINKIGIGGSTQVLIQNLKLKNDSDVALEVSWYEANVTVADGVIIEGNNENQVKINNSCTLRISGNAEIGKACLGSGATITICGQLTGSTPVAIIHSEYDKPDKEHQKIQLLVADSVTGTTLADEVIKFEYASGYDYFIGTDGYMYSKEFVDLGIEGGTLWAKCNIGAATPWNYGGYFAWGETEPKTVFSGTDSNGLPETLSPENDAAAKIWGSECSMPTVSDFQQLYNECYWEWTDSYDGTNVAGYIVYRSKDKTKDYGKTHNSGEEYKIDEVRDHIFLPAAGSYHDSPSTPQSEGVSGNYWSASSTGNYPYDCGFNRNGVYPNNNVNKWSGLSIRPIKRQQ